jgi:hypothetical protein
MHRLHGRDSNCIIDVAPFDHNHQAKTWKIGDVIAVSVLPGMQQVLTALLMVAVVAAACGEHEKK